jgi:hypothetical protein
MKWPEQYRYRGSLSEWTTNPGDPFGWFIIPASTLIPRGLKVMASDGAADELYDTGWEHVSVSRLVRESTPPSWEEMCLVKGLFWADDECVVQFHPPKADYVNQHPGVLHLWRKKGAEAFPMPPKACV